MSDANWAPRTTPEGERKPSSGTLRDASKVEVVRLLLTFHDDDDTEPSFTEVIDDLLETDSTSQPMFDNAKIVKRMVEECDALVPRWYDRPLPEGSPDGAKSNKERFDTLLAAVDHDVIVRLARSIIRAIGKASATAAPRRPQTINVVTNTEDAATPLFLLFVVALALRFIDSSGKTVSRLCMGPPQCPLRALMAAILYPEVTRFLDLFENNQGGTCPQPLLYLRSALLENPIAAKLRARLESNAAEGDVIAYLPDRNNPLEICDDAAWRWFAKLIVLVALSSQENKVGVPHNQVNITLMIHCIERCTNFKELSEMKKSEIVKRQPSGFLLVEMAPLAAKCETTSFYGNYWSGSDFKAPNKRGRMDGCGSGPIATLNIAPAAADAPPVTKEYCYYCGGDCVNKVPKAFCPWPNILQFIYLLPGQTIPHRFTRGAWGDWTPADVLNLKFGFKKQ